MPDASALEAEYAARFGSPVAGIDEVGRGPWAGPVVAAAAVLSAPYPDGLDDSKRLSPRRREAIFRELLPLVRFGLGRAEPAEIDALGLGVAADLAMLRALEALMETGPVAAAVIDGTRVPPACPVPAASLVRGDARLPAIAAASILAKVTRDREMQALALSHPGYGWERNMGYGTAEHRSALERLGTTPHHRRSFRPISQHLHEKNHIND